MYRPKSLHVRSYTCQSLRSNELCRKSFYLSNNVKKLVKRTLPKQSSISSSLPKKIMQQQTTSAMSSESMIGVASRLCSVCGDISTGIHFGGNSCESCKAFFRRSVQCNRHQNYKCSNKEECLVNIVTRKVCQYCRYIKCTAIGMKPKWVLTDQERAEKYGSRRKRCREARANDEDPEIYKYLTREEKLLIEDIAHALYQSRATYPLQFPSQLNQYLTMMASGKAPPSPASGEKPPNPSANFLIVPIQRFVLFARMLKDFDLFSEDDKVNLLKGSAIEVVVCSSNTLFNSKTHTFTNYLSRDQRAVMDDQIMPLDPLLKKIWGDEIFDRTKSFLVSMCNLHIDEVTSTLLAPVILFSPDRSNVKDLDLVKRLQVKYVTIINKYMRWRYGIENADIIYPKLLLQIINIRTLGLAHAEIIQKVMSTSSVNPLVQEVTIKPEVSYRSTTDKMNSMSLPSTPNQSEITGYDTTPSMDTESNLDSDDDDVVETKPRLLVTEDYDNDDSNETNPQNIWRKRRKLCTSTQPEPFKIETNDLPTQVHQIKQEFVRSNSIESESQTSSKSVYKRPHDHQVPSFAPTTYYDDINISNRASPMRHFPLKKQSLVGKPSYFDEQMHRRQLSSSTNDLSSYDHHLRSNQMSHLPPVNQHHHPHSNTYGNYYQQHTQVSPVSNFQQQQHNEQHLLRLSLANNHGQTSSFQPLINHQTHSNVSLDADEQQLLNAIHAHPNKRDVVLNLLRQINETAATPSMNYQGNTNYHAQQHRRLEPSPNYDPYRQHSSMDHNNQSFQ